MISNTHHDQDMHGQGMETLSALFDGELQGDAARFAMKRLGHDPQWRQAFGNWQLLGDALRGHAGSVAPGDFAARVAAAVSAEPGGATAAVTASARRKWVGGAALAASVAMVALFVARPFSQDSGMPAGSVPVPIELATAPRPIPTPIPAPEAIPALPDTAFPVGAATIAAAEAPRRVDARRSRGQSQRVALRASRRPMAIPAVAGAATTTAVAITDRLQHTSTNPFHPPQVEVVSRPWPRAVLPGSHAAGALTASYGAGATSSPSFYPFEPRLPGAADAGPVPVDADERRR